MTESTRADRPSFYRTLADRHPTFMQAESTGGRHWAEPKAELQLAVQQRQSAGAQTQ